VGLAAVSVAFLVVRSRVNYKFPVPWPDEASFLYQALSFRDGWTLFAPEIHPLREVLWMPPAFMVLEGLIFKVVPFSLGAARTLSGIYLLLAVVCFVKTFESRGLLRQVILAGAFLATPLFLFAGNTARMETLVLLCVASGFLALHRGRFGGLGFLALAPLVHPVGLIPFAGGAAYWLVGVRRRPVLARWEYFVLGAATSAWLIYGLHVLSHWEGFVDDFL